MLTDYMYQEKKDKAGLTALKTALAHRYNDSKTIYQKLRWRTDYSHQKRY